MIAIPSRGAGNGARGIAPGADRWWQSASARRIVALDYVPFVALAHLAWEVAQLPLYSLWTTASPGKIAYAVLHCTAGDVLIALGALAAALTLTGSGAFADWRLRRIGALTLAFGLAYTIASERVNVALGNWGYAAAMPIVPMLEAGLSPVAQWIAVPLLAFAWLARRRRTAPSAGASGA